MYIYIYIYIHMFVYICIYTPVCIYAYTHAYTHTLAHTHIYIHVYIHAYMYMHMYVSEHICIYVYMYIYVYMHICIYLYICSKISIYIVIMLTLLDGYCSTVQGLLDWFEVDLGFTELLFIQIDLCVVCVFVLYSPVSLSSCPFFGHPALPPPRGWSTSRVSPQSCQSHESLWGL